jgi:radical SAM superfamily enzyme YgiQ (UPF0313 family)
MKIALINPPWYDLQRTTLWGVRAGSRWPHFQKRQAANTLPRYLPFPFFLAIAARILMNSGKEVLLLDGVAEGTTLEVFFKKIRQFQPEVIFIETSTPSALWDAGIMRAIKEMLPRLIVIAGGCIAPALASELFLKKKLADYWITGEYDFALNELIDALQKNKNPHAVRGVITAEKPANAPAKVEELDKLPPPLYEQLPIKNYSDPVCGLPAPSAVSWLSRGCPFGCTFCVWPQVFYFDRKYRTRSIAKALDEIAFLIENYGCESYYFDDDTTNIGEARMVELATAIKKRKLNFIPWSMMARADCMSKKALSALADAGLYSIKYGVESADPALLKKCGKNINLKKLVDAIKYTKECGIKVHLTFTLGLPGETKETIKKTLDFAFAVEPETAQFSLCTPFPGTVFYEECLKNKWLITDDWSRFLGSEEAVIGTPALSAEELNKAFNEVCGLWSNFVKQRDDERKKALKDKLKILIESGERWALLGEREMAVFLFEEEPIRNAFVENSYKDTVIVIASRHNEEKIWRKLWQSNSGHNKPILKLYG